jgi:hypothetical protein
MKTQLILISMLALGYQKLQATTVQDLAVNCTMQAKVTDVYNVKYKAGAPPHYRFPGIDPSVGFQASLEVLSQDEGCAVLNKKYNIFIGSLSASGGYAAGQEADVAKALQLKNQVVTLNLKQYIGYKINEQYLPLFPLVHSETLNLNFTSDGISGSVPLPFNLNWVYNMKAVENMSDIEKLSLAEKVSTFVFGKGKNSGVYSEYETLFLQLEPQQQILKKSYALLIWKMLNEYKLSTPYSKQVLDFHVGGDGSFYGEPLAVKLNHISHLTGTFSDDEIVDLITEFPTWILAGYSGNDCLNFTAENLENAVKNLQLKLPVMTAGEKYSLKAPMVHIAGPVHYISTCTQEKVTETTKELASYILKALN